MHRLILIFCFLVISFCLSPPKAAYAQTPPDLNNDGWVDIQDMSLLITNFSQFTIFNLNQIVFHFNQDINHSPTATLTPTGGPPPTIYTFTDGYGGDVDTGIDVNLHSAAHTLNSGQHGAIQFGNYNYGLIRFNISGIPAGATVTQAKLYLGLYQGGGNANIYAILPENDGWIEGTGDFDPALENEPCWDAKQADGSGGIKTAWAGGSNGGGVPGIDITSDPIGILNANGQGIGIYAVDLDLDIVQGWVGGDSSNYGILIKPTVTSPYHIALAEYGTAEYRPKLFIEYLVP